MTAIQTQRLPTPRDARASAARARRTLAAAGIQEAALEADVLVCHALSMDRAQLFAHPERRATGAQQAALEGLLERRLTREPLAYILGARDFYGLPFAVTPAVMVPRPETELLVEQALAWARKRASVLPPTKGGSERDGESAGVPLTIADVGTGSGCVAVSLAVHLPQARILATDASAEALAVAESNIRRHGVQGRVDLLHGSLLEPLTRPVDLIVANLPYVRDGEIAGLQPEVHDWEPRAALAGGPDGTVLLRALLAQAPAHLGPGGAVILEMDHRQRRVVAEAAVGALRGASVRVVRDLAGLDRVLAVELT